MCVCVLASDEEISFYIRRQNDDDSIRNSLALMCIRIKYFCLRTDEECVDDNFILGDVANILLLINKIHSYFSFVFYSYTDVRLEATNRINKRKGD